MAGPKTSRSGLEREIKDLDRQIREARREATAAPTLEEKLEGQKQIKALEAQRNEKRRTLFDAQDEVDKQREQFIATIEGKLAQNVSLQSLFRVRWVLGGAWLNLCPLISVDEGVDRLSCRGSPQCGLARQPALAGAEENGVLYWKASFQKPPRWISLFTGRLKNALAQVTSGNAAPALFLNVEGRWFALCFGYGRNLLKPGATREIWLARCP